MLKKARQRRKAKIRSRISGTTATPRLVVYRSNKYIYAQIIDDTTGKTVAQISESKNTKLKGTKAEKAALIGAELAKLAKSKKINKIVFDRAGYAYHGRIKALAEAARTGGLKF